MTQTHTPIKKMADKEMVVKRPRVLHFSSHKKANRGMELETGIFDNFKMSENKLLKNIRNMRKIAKTPYKVLDAPGLQDDFYQDILDWSSKDIIAIALSSSLYFWSNKESENNVVKVSEAPENSIYSSLKWNTSGQFLSTGTS